METSNPNTGPTTIALPASYMREIGRIMVYWAHIEFLLRRTTHEAAGIGQKLGRVALMEPKPPGVPDHIRKIFQARQIKPPKIPKKFIKEIDAFYERRNALAHGVWLKMKNNKYPVLQYTRGADQKTSSPNNESAGYKINPVSIKLTTAELRELAEEFKAFVQVVNRFKQYILAALPPSQEKCASPPKPSNHRPD